MNERPTILDWDESDRPREKFLEKGTQSLSNAELLAILIGSGSSKETAVDLCKRVLAASNNKLSELGKTSVGKLCKEFHGIGEAKAITILSAIELGRRRALEENELTVFNSPEQVGNYMTQLLSDTPNEEFWSIFLTHSNKVIRKTLIAKGGITQTTVDVRLILREALDANATRIILCHNHPSGNIHPSEDDKRLTNHIAQAAAMMDLKVIDHIIVGGNKYFSFNDENLI